MANDFMFLGPEKQKKTQLQFGAFRATCDDARD